MKSSLFTTASLAKRQLQRLRTVSRTTRRTFTADERKLTRAPLDFCTLETLEELPTTESIVFEFGKDRHGFPREAFVFVLGVDEGGGEADVLHRSRCYVNECAHQGVPLDWEDGDFFGKDGGRRPKRDETERGGVIVCKTHGAQFRVGDGVCVRGPCKNKRLQRLKLTADEEEQVWVEGVGVEEGAVRRVER